MEIKSARSVSASSVVATLRELERVSNMPALFVSDYVGPALRDTLASEGFSFADATGWVRLTSDEPLILLTGQGAVRSPRAPRTTAVTRLNGLAASRIIRALASVDVPMGVRALASEARVSPGSVSKLLATLHSEGIVERDVNGGVLVVRRRALMRRWVVDYSFAKTNSSIGYFIAPRGLSRALARFDGQQDVAITGSAAARRLLPASLTSVVPLRLLAVYAARPTELAGDLGLIDADSATANVIIARPQDLDILGPSGRSAVPTAPPPIVIADLLTLPGRSDAEAGQLMDAFAASDEAWRQ